MPDDHHIGAVLGSYRIESLIGRGAMGVVYLAEHLHLQRKVALKVLAHHLADDEAFRNRFVRESRLAAALEHPNIIPVYDAGDSSGELYIAMRFVDGTDLATIIEREGRLDTSRILSILSRVGSALDAAHRRGLVHRDVKPGNILIGHPQDPDEEVFLSDFGVVKAMDASTQLTHPGYFVGTIAYTAPEAFGGERLDSRADVYSLACVLYECLCGHPPFVFDSQAAVIAAHLFQPPPGLRTARPDLPAELEAVLVMGLAKDREDRQRSSGELMDSARAAMATDREDAGAGSPSLARASDAGSGAVTGPTPEASIEKPTAVAATRTSPPVEEPPMAVGALSPAAQPSPGDSPLPHEGFGVSSDAVQTHPPPARSGRRVPVVLGLLAAMVVVAGGIVAVALLWRDGGTTLPGPPPPPPPTSPSSPTPGTIQGRIAFDSHHAVIAVIRPGGKAGPRSVRSAGVLGDDPSWSPDGTRVAFDSSHRDIYVMNADGTGVTLLVSSPLSFEDPAWSPDGARIAFDSDTSGSEGIYVMTLAGTTGPVRLTSGPDLNPAWSPDGTRIAFNSARSGSQQIWVVNAGGSATPTQVTSVSGVAEEPAWSPNGKALAFQGGTSGHHEIIVANADGTNSRPLTDDAADDQDPAWSPNGRWIAFDADDASGNRQIFVIPASGTGKEEQITHTTGPNQDPAWVPGSGSPSSETPSSGPPFAAPPVPSLSAAAVDQHTIELNWTGVDRVEGYRIFRGPTLAPTVGPTETSVVESGINPETRYCYAIQAFNSGGSSPKVTACKMTPRPVITSITPEPAAARPSRTITISGLGFGTHPSFQGDLPCFELKDVTGHWAAGHVDPVDGRPGASCSADHIPSGDSVTVVILRWADDEILLGGFGVNYGKGGYFALHPGDKLVIRVWNAQTGAGTLPFDISVAG